MDSNLRPLASNFKYEGRVMVDSNMRQKTFGLDFKCSNKHKFKGRVTVDSNLGHLVSYLICIIVLAVVLNFRPLISNIIRTLSFGQLTHASLLLLCIAHDKKNNNNNQFIRFCKLHALIMNDQTSKK